MNNQIRELAEQAGFYFYDMHNVDGQDLGETVEADSWRVPEAFAKLIVQECKDTLLFHGYDEAVPYIEWMAKNRFGVE